MAMGRVLLQKSAARGNGPVVWRERAGDVSRDGHGAVLLQNSAAAGNSVMGRRE